MLRVYVDFKSPSAYLAMKPTLALVSDVGADVSWHPFASAQRPLPVKVPGEDTGQSHRRVRAESNHRIHAKYAAIQGLGLTFRQPPGQTDLALGAMALLGDDCLPFVTAAFEAYWQRGADLDDVETVANLISASGLNVGKFDPKCARNTFLRAQAEAEARGIVDAPAYLIADQLFIGRAHLPWIAEILRQ